MASSCFHHTRKSLCLCLHVVLVSLLLLARIQSVVGEGLRFTHPKLQGRRLVTSDVINEEFVVVFNDDYLNNKTFNVADEAQKLLGSKDRKKLMRTYNNALKGFVIKEGIDINQIKSILDNVNVQFVEPNSYFYASDVQNNASWGLDRIDQENLPLNGKYNYTNDGRNVSVYVLDTGMRLTHVEFGGRAKCSFDATLVNGTCNDVVGHGTHVAGIIGGGNFGVAKKANLFSVKVLGDDGSGKLDGILAGIDHVIKQKKASNSTAMVINMSLGSYRSAALNSAVNTAADAGIVVVVAAGNENRDACYYSPASASKVITVGATKIEFSATTRTLSDVRSSFSNYGQCLNLFAPGSDIRSAFKPTDNSYATLQGTSMASPAVAGVAALYLQQNRSLTPYQVYERMVYDSSKNKVLNAGRYSPNLLLNKKNL